MKLTVKEPARQEYRMGQGQREYSNGPQQMDFLWLSVKRCLKISDLVGNVFRVFFRIRFGNYAISTWNGYRLLRSNYIRTCQFKPTVNCFSVFRKMGLAYALVVWLGGHRLTSGVKKSKRAYALLALLSLWLFWCPLFLLLFASLACFGYQLDNDG